MHQHTGMHEQFVNSDRIVEGKVVGQRCAFGVDGNIITINSIEVYRAFGTTSGPGQIDVITEGGIVGDVAQVVHPCVSLPINKIVILGLEELDHGSRVEFSLEYDEPTAQFATSEGLKEPTEVYNGIAHAKGTGLSVFQEIPTWEIDERMAAPTIGSFTPSVISAGTMQELSIYGSGFGSTQGTGCVSFSNADNGGQSFVNLQAGPHYLSWSDTEIRVLVPSSVLFQTVVAGTGTVRITSHSGAVTTSPQELRIDFAKSAVLYNDQIGQTSLIGAVDGGYELEIGQGLANFLPNNGLVEKAINKWSCNTGINFKPIAGQNPSEVFSMDETSVIGMAAPGTLPSSVLGKTITTFSGCGGGNGTDWLLQEVDILFNPTVNWYKGEGITPASKFDLMTVMIHELGHAHLLQHNNNEHSVMYYELNQNASRRFLNQDSDIYGGSTVVDHSVYDASVCSNSTMDFFNDTDCDLSLVNSIEEENTLTVLIAPNPSEGLFTVQGVETGQVINIIDVSGRLQMNKVVSTARQEFDLTHLPSGVYFLTIVGETVAPQKLILH